MSYFQVDKGIINSSLWIFGTPEEFKLWSYLMYTAKPATGVVDEPAWLLAEHTKLSIEQVEKALAAFASPDPRSRTKREDGRRIRIEDGKIVLLNYLSFRDKDHSTERVRSWRERKRSETAGNGLKRRSTVTATVKREATPPGTQGQGQGQGHITENETDCRADARPSTPEPVGPPAWSKEANDDWIAQYEGTAPGGPIGRHLKPLVAKYGWERVRPAWRAYLLATESQYANPARFAATYGTWKVTPKAAPPPPDPLPEQQPEAAAFFDSMRTRLSGILSREALATWFRPVEGRAWEGDTLVLTVPSKQFADQLRFYAPRMRAAGAELGRPELHFRTIVVAEEAVVHDGSIR